MRQLLRPLALPPVLWLAACSSEPEVDEFGWESTDFDELVEIELQIRQDLEWYQASPEITPIRFYTADEQPDAMSTCMEERGWEGIREVTDVLQVPSDQLRAAEEDVWECMSLHPKDPRTIADFFPAPEEFHRAHYEAEEEVRQCVRENGWDVPDAPSFEVFVQAQEDTALAAELRHPHFEILESDGSGEFDAAQQTCPYPDTEQFLPEVPDP